MSRNKARLSLRGQDTPGSTASRLPTSQKDLIRHSAISRGGSLLLEQRWGFKARAALNDQSVIRPTSSPLSSIWNPCSRALELPSHDKVAVRHHLRRLENTDS